MKEKTNISYGNIDVENDLNEPVKVRTTIFLESELRENLKKEAHEKNIKWQQLLRDILRQHFHGTSAYSRDSSNALKEIEERLARLEKLQKSG